MTIHRVLRTAALGLGLAACQSDNFEPPPGPPVDASLDAQVRQTIGNWGVVPILAMKSPDPALVDLGRSLFFDKILSGNRDVSCATCHNPLTQGGDGRSLAVGTGWSGSSITARTLGKGREFTPRNAPSLFNSSLGLFYMFWDGRVNEELGPGRFRTPTGMTLPGGLTNLLAAQAMIPVTNRVEMRGVSGDRDVQGNVNELTAFSDTQNTAIWDAAMKRVLSIPEYLQKFTVAYPGVPASQFAFQHAANALAAFETKAFAKTNTDFDRFLARNDNALSTDAKRGALLFFGRALCSSCHNGPLLGGQGFASVGVPQIGPGMGNAAPLDVGRDDFGGGVRPPNPLFMFRIPALRNVELTAPYMHDGAYANLETVVRHYNNVDSAVKSFDASQLDPSVRSSYHGDVATTTKVLTAVDGRLRSPMRLTLEEQKQLVAFLKSLTDPSARDLSSVIPASVPSGLPVRE